MCASACLLIGLKQLQLYRVLLFYFNHSNMFIAIFVVPRAAHSYSKKDAKSATGKTIVEVPAIDWVKLEKRQCKPVFQPSKAKDAAGNFDSDFTNEPPTLTPTAKNRIAQIPQVCAMRPRRL